jgi:hypothetical protein
MSEQKKQTVTIVTDWRLDVSGGRTYGVCTVDVPDPYKYLTFSRGFPLTNPTHVRCAIFSVLLGAEIALSAGRELGDKFVAIVTRLPAASQLLGAPRTRQWAEGDARNPQSIAGFRKPFLRNLLRLLDELKQRGGDLVVVETSKEDQERDVMLSHSVNLDVDPERDMARGSSNGDEDQVKHRLDQLRKRDFLKVELMQMQGVRPSRQNRRPTKKQMQKIACGKKMITNEQNSDGNPTPNSPATGGPGPGAGDPSAGASGGLDTGSAGTSPADARDRSRDGAETAVPGGDVQGAEPGAGGREQQTPE